MTEFFITVPVKTSETWVVNAKTVRGAKAKLKRVLNGLGAELENADCYQMDDIGQDATRTMTTSRWTVGLSDGTDVKGKST